MNWKLENMDEKTAVRALEVHIKEIDIDLDPPRAVFVGSKGDLHTATIESCDCVDYQLKGLKLKRPCKHIVRILLECGKLSRSALNDYLDFRNRKEKQLEEECQSYFQKHFISGEHTAPEIPAETQSSQTVSIGECPMTADEIKSFLKSHEAEYVDLTPKGGSIYFFDKSIADKLKSMGCAVAYARKGTRGTSWRPAWYIRL